MSDDLNELYQQVILDHSRAPRNYRPLADANHKAEGHNPLCGDRVTVYLRMEGDVIQELGFQGSGCAISKAAASMMTSYLKGKTRQEAQLIFQKFRSMVTTGEVEQDSIGKLSVFAGVNRFPARVKCAILPWHAMVAALDDKNQPVSTE